MNGVYLRGLDAGGVRAGGCARFLAERHSPLADADGLEAAAPLVQEKIGALGEFEDFAGFLFHPVVYEAQAWEQARRRAEARGRCSTARRRPSRRCPTPLDAEARRRRRCAAWWSGSA